MYEFSTPVPRPPQRPVLRRYLGRFPGGLASVKDARDWLDRRLELSLVPGSSAQDALLILSEVATNALLHSPAGARGRAFFFVSVFVSGGCLRVSVRGSRDTPAPVLQAAPAEPEAEHGRGLFLVDALAATWGVEHTRQGPAVFFTLEWAKEEPPPTAPAPRTPSRHLDG